MNSRFEKDRKGIESQEIHIQSASDPNPNLGFQTMRSIDLNNPTAWLNAMFPILAGIIFIVLGCVVVFWLPALIAALVLGVLFSAFTSFIVIVAMPRAMQISIMGAAIGVSADASYAKFNDQTPITIANALVDLSHSLIKILAIIADDAKITSDDAKINEVMTFAPYFVWAFILSMIVFMGLSFLIKHDG